MNTQLANENFYILFISIYLSIIKAWQQKYFDGNKILNTFKESHANSYFTSYLLISWLTTMAYYLIYSIFTFPASIYLRYLKLTVSDGGYESDDESIWSEEDEQTPEDIHNYGEHLSTV